MYGKHFQSMYTGSMVGAGADVFAVWGYVISNMRPDEKVGAQVELNPKLLAFILGEKEEVVVKALEKLCAPDTNSRTQDKEGRRLEKVGQFDYVVVNGAKYLAIKDEGARREYNRRKKQEERARKSPKVKPVKPLAGETEFLKAEAAGAGPEVLDGIVDKHLPDEAR